MQLSGETESRQRGRWSPEAERWVTKVEAGSESEREVER